MAASPLRPPNPLGAAVSLEPDGRVVWAPVLPATDGLRMTVLSLVTRRNVSFAETYAVFSSELAERGFTVLVDHTAPVVVPSSPVSHLKSRVLVAAPHETLTALRPVYTPIGGSGVLVTTAFDAVANMTITPTSPMTLPLFAALWDHLPRVGPQMAHSFAHNVVFPQGIIPISSESDCPNASGHFSPDAPRLYRRDFVGCPFSSTEELLSEAAAVAPTDPRYISLYVAALRFGGFEDDRRRVLAARLLEGGLPPGRVVAELDALTAG